MLRAALTIALTAAALAATGTTAAQTKGAAAPAARTVKFAYLDPLSGPFANVGQNQLKSWQFMAEHFNKKNPAGVKFEIVGFSP